MNEVQVLIAGSNAELIKQFKTKYKTQQLNLIVTKGPRETLDMVNLIQEFSLILVLDDVGSKEERLKLLKEIKKKNVDAQVISIGEDQADLKNIKWIPEGLTQEEVFTESIELIENEIKANHEDNYRAVSIELFFETDEIMTLVDVYLKISKNKKNYRFLKRFSANDKIGQSDIQEYLKHGVKELYIKKQDQELFLKFMTTKLKIEAEKKKNLAAQRLIIAAKVNLLEKEKLKVLGVTNQTLEAVNESLKIMVENIRENKTLINHLALMKKNGLSYSYTHSYMMTLIFFKVIPKFDWGNDKALEKFIYAAFFHDLSLEEDFELSIRTPSELELFSNDAKVYNKVNQHALNASVLLAKSDKIPLDVAQIVKEHHGSKSGIGFHEELPSNLSVMGAVFLTVEEFISRIGSTESTLDQHILSDILFSMSEKFDKNPFKQTLDYMKEEFLGN